MKRVKGVVRNNVVVLEQGAQLPEGAEVEVRVVEPETPNRDEAFARVLANRTHHYVGIDEIIEEEKAERERRAEEWIH